MRLLFVTLALTATLTIPARAEVAAGRVLLKLDAPIKTDLEARESLNALPSAQELGLELSRRSILGWVVATVRATTESETLAAVERLRADKGVLAAEPDGIQRALRAPNDERYSELWGFQYIGAEAAWDVTTGLSSQRIGMVDSGINRDHIDLIEHDVYGYDFISDAQIAEDGNGRDANYQDVSPDSHFHGSHVAGTMVASANDGIGVPGLNWSAGLVTARALGAEGSGLGGDIVEAAAWMAGFEIPGVPNVGAHRVSVINLSLGTLGACSSFEADVYGAIVESGVTVVVAAGNEGNDVPTGSPANCPGVIAVGAAGPTGELAWYSNFDDRIDVVAPGGAGTGEDDSAEAILSVDGADDYSHKSIDGTSMAAPHVAGVVSLMQAVNPKLSPRQIKDILFQSPYTCTGCNNEAFLDAADAVERARSTDGELDDAPSGGGSDEPSASCPPHSTPISDGESCYCDAGYQVNQARTGCVPEGTDEGGDKPDADRDDNDDRRDDDDDDDDDDEPRRRYFTGCSASGAEVSLVSLLALLFLARRRAVRPS